jgi:hypothetical protein
MSAYSPPVHTPGRRRQERGTGAGHPRGSRSMTVMMRVTP